MGRYNFAAARVRSSVSALLETNRLPAPPPWYDVTSQIPPSEVLVRPLQHVPSASTRRNKRPSRMFQPAQISYPEDKLRQRFFQDHPWELARPRVVLENDGHDSKNWDWGTGIMQPGKALDGESVVQRQLWLIHNKKMRPSAAYDQARHEFYEHRYKEALARRIAVEEALATGAYFGKNALQIGMELEDKAWEDWRAWAMKEAETSQQLRAAQYGPMEADDDAIVATADDIEPIAEEAVEVVADPVKS